MLEFITQPPVDIIGNVTTPATLTATASDNTKSLAVGKLAKLGLLIQYTPNAAGAANSYVTITVDHSPNGTTWFAFGSVIYGATENQVFDNPFIVPGDKISTPGTAERMSLWVDMPPFVQASASGVEKVSLRVSVKESVAANFGTIWIALARLEYV